MTLSKRRERFLSHADSWRWAVYRTILRINGLQVSPDSLRFRNFCRVALEELNYLFRTVPARPDINESLWVVVVIFPPLIFLSKMLRHSEDVFQLYIRG
jgi:hypothetical protein